MASPLDRLHERLREAGVAPGPARRLVEELEDHLACSGEAPAAPSTDSEAAIEARLGRIEDLVAAALEDPRGLSPARRWPRLIFGCTPPLVLAALPPAAAGLIAGISEGAVLLTGSPLGRGATFAVAESLRAGGHLLLPPLLVAAYAWLGRRGRCPIHWPLIAGLIVGVLSSIVATELTYDAATPSDTPFSFFIGLGVRARGIGGPYVLAHPAAAFATFASVGGAALLLWLDRRRRGADADPLPLI